MYATVVNKPLLLLLYACRIIEYFTSFKSFAVFYTITIKKPFY